MEKFCTKCGKKLDGHPCDCESRETVQTQTAGVDVNQLLSVVKGMFTHPVDTMKEFIGDHNLVSGLIFLGINIIVIGLFLCLGVKELVGAFSYGAGLSDLLMSNVDIPYAQIFFTTVVVLAIVYAALAGLFYLISDKLFKGASSYQKMITLLGVTSIVLTVGLLGSIVFMYVSMQLMLILLCCTFMLQSVYTIQGFASASDLDENKLGYTYMIVYAIVLVFTMFILPSIMG